MGRQAIAVTLAACAAVGVLAALDTRTIFVVLAACALLGLCVLAYRHPDRLVPISVFLVLVAGTKFRNRDPTESLANVLDGQIVLELGLYACVGLIVGVTLLSPKLRWSPLSLPERLFVGFVVLAGCSTVWSDAPAFTAVRAVQAGLLLALGLTAPRVLGAAATLRAVAAAITVYVLVCAGLAVLFPWARGTTTDAQGKVRFSWFAMHSISAATFTAFVILYVSCVLLFGAEGWRRRWRGIPVVLVLAPLGAIMIAANSRGPLFALLGALGAVLAFRYLRPATTLTLVAAAAFVVVVGMLAGATPESILASGARQNSRAADLVLRGQTVGELGTLTGRTELWTKLIPVYLDRPLLGYGYQASRGVLLQVQPWAGHAHNAVLETLLDVGLLGAVLLWAPFFATLFARTAARGPARSDAAWLGAVVFAFATFFLLSSVSDVAFAGPPDYEMLVLFCCVAAVEHARRENAGRAPRAAFNRTGVGPEGHPIARGRTLTGEGADGEPAAAFAAGRLR